MSEDIKLMQGFVYSNEWRGGKKGWFGENLLRKHHRVFSFPVLLDKELFLESRLRESFHVLRLSNRLCRLCYSVFSLLSHGHWTHSRENNGSRVVGTSHAGWPQMCQGYWQRGQGEGGGKSGNANLPFCWAVRLAPVLLIAQREWRHQNFIISAADTFDAGIYNQQMCWSAWMHSTLLRAFKCNDK